MGVRPPSLEALRDHRRVPQPGYYSGGPATPLEPWGAIPADIKERAAALDRQTGTYQDIDDFNRWRGNSTAFLMPMAYDADGGSIR